MENTAYVGAIIADIHVGAIDAKQLYKELDNTTLSKLRSLAILDFIVIVGDYFDKNISVNSSHAKMAVKYFIELLEICKEKKTKFRMIKGTKSHDNEQLEMLKELAKKHECDFKLINTVENEWLFEDMHVLYLPEEYLTDKDEYYKDYFDKEYDMIFGHGLVNEVVFVASKQEGEITLSKAPVFKTDQLLSICKGPIFFGHIHTPQVIKDRFIYVGSLSRWCFGQEEDKGFYLTTYSPNNSGYMTEFVKNEWCKRYDTVVVDYSSKFFKDNEKQQIDFLVKLVDGLVIDHLRIIVNIPEDYPNPLLLTSMVNEVFSKYSNIKVLVNNNSKLRQKKETEDKINLLLDKYGFIFDKTLSHEEKISKFVKLKYNRNIPIDRVREYIYQKILEGGTTHDSKE